MSSNYDLNLAQIADLAKERAFIPDETWATVRHWSVNATADFVVTRRPVRGFQQFLLARRAEPPWEEQWFIPGGRIRPMETSTEACRRNVKRELGFEPRELRYVGEQPVYNPDSPEGVDWFSLWHLYEVPVETSQVFRPNRENLELEWFEWIDSEWPWPVCQALELVGFNY